MTRNVIFSGLIKEIQSCELCNDFLPLGARPVLRIHPKARILIAGQAPGIRVHNSGIPFNDPSGDRLREWMGIDREKFYTAEDIAIVPMGLCYPGTGERGDYPPRPECAKQWREKILSLLPDIELVLAIGIYAQRWHTKGKYSSLSDRVKAWRDFWPEVMPLPHPSPRNNGWLKRNPWFGEDVLPALRTRIGELL